MIEAERTPGFLHLLQLTGGASWLHMCIHHRETEGFLSSATGLDKLIAAAMVSEDTRSRLRVHGQGVMVLLKAMHLGTSRNPFFAAIRREVTHKCQVRGF